MISQFFFLFKVALGPAVHPEVREFEDKLVSGTIFIPSQGEG